MNKFLSFRGGLLIVAVAALVALGVAYAVQIQRGVTGAVIIGRVQTAEETLLLYSQPSSQYRRPDTAEFRDGGH